LYESIALNEALAKLNATVRARLSKEGLSEANWRAYGVDAVSGKVVIRANGLSVPSIYSGSQRTRAMQIVHEECDRFLLERCGPG
jgi:hypothetical protein